MKTITGRKGIKDIIVDSKMITDEQMKAANDEAKKSGLPLRV